MTDFDDAVRCVITGDLAELARLLARRPTLVTERSTSPHRATLLHYVAANGVEDDLQVVPQNASEVARLLLGAGAEVDAVAETYGGGLAQTTLYLLVTSWPPQAAGVQAQLVEVLLDAGAAIEGLANDGLPLRSALLFGYTASATVLAERGASVIGIVAFAGLGYLEKLAMCLRHAGGLPTSSWDTRDPDQRDLSEGQLVLRALGVACANNQFDAAAYLLEQGADINAQHKILTDCTPLHRAVSEHRKQMVAFLLEHGARADVAAKTGRMTALQLAEISGAKDLVAMLASGTI